MSYVFFDLEWNQGYPHSVEDKLDEIIQIGACCLEQWDSQPEPFSCYVRPTIHKKLHHRVRKMLPLDMDTLKQADGFRAAARKFFQWCGSDPVFFTWGNSDIRVLDMNLCWYGMEEFLELEIYDLQRAFDLLVLHTDQQAALKDAVETLGLGEDREYHDAGNDAFYTALIGAELIAREKSALYAAMSGTPTEKAALNGSLTTFGGLTWETPSNFPARGLVVTSYDNLSIYMQDGSWRRNIKDAPEKDRVEDYNSRNEGYVVETPEKFAALEFGNVVFYGEKTWKAAA